MSERKDDFWESPGGEPDRSGPDILDSWKEIADYFRRDVRVVFQWEKSEGLPVRRHDPDVASSVYAYRSELDVWWHHARERLAAEFPATESPAAAASPDPQPDPLAAVTNAQPARRRASMPMAITLTALLLVVIGWFAARIRSKTSALSSIPDKIVVAVLPFDDLSAEPQEYLVDSLTEEMISRLTRAGSERLQVIARASSMQYRSTQKGVRQIGEELGANYLLSGSIRHDDDRFRIATQLVRASDQKPLWAKTYEGGMREILPLESKVTADIAEQIHVQLSATIAAGYLSGPGTADPDAHQLYLKGRYFFNQRSREGLQKSVDYFHQALARDPNYAAAYAGLADSWNLIAFYGFDPTLSAVEQARDSADKALQLDNSMAAPHAARAYTEFMWQNNWPGAEQEFQKALQLDGNYAPAHHWYALLLSAEGRIDESLREMKKAQQLDPVSPAVHAAFGYIFYFARDYDHALEHARVALKVNPDFMPAHAVMGWAWIGKKNYTQAIKELGAAADLSHGVPVYVCALGRAYALSGNTREARRILVRQLDLVAGEPSGSGSSIAGLYVALGDPESALHWLNVSATGDIQANWLEVEPAFDSLRGDPRFTEILRRAAAKNGSGNVNRNGKTAR